MWEYNAGQVGHHIPEFVGIKKMSFQTMHELARNQAHVFVGKGTVNGFCDQKGSWSMLRKRISASEVAPTFSDLPLSALHEWG